MTPSTKPFRWTLSRTLFHNHNNCKHQYAIHIHLLLQRHLTILSIAAPRATVEHRAQYRYLPNPLMHTASFLACITVLEQASVDQDIGMFGLSIIVYVVQVGGDEVVEHGGSWWCRCMGWILTKFSQSALTAG